MWVMIQDKYLEFITRKIKELRSALFFDLTPSEIGFPASIINIVKTDDEGNIFFVLRKPYCELSDKAPSFSAQLQFYNRNCNFHIMVMGKAFIMNKADLSQFDKITIYNWLRSNEVLVQLRILSAEYSFYNKEKKFSFRNYLKKIFNWLFNEKIADNSLSLQFSY